MFPVDPYNIGLMAVLFTLVFILLIEAVMRAWKER